MMIEDQKIISDPVYGFVPVSDPLVFRIIGHPYFQRLRRISQNGLSSLVFPGAVHNRFQHSLGAMYLMQTALNQLQAKGVAISEDERRGALVAILLHDVGHSAFSHTLEHHFVKELTHEDISLEIMKLFNASFAKGELDVAIQIFEDSYPRPFFHQLISNQLDMDRLDYLRRDSFYTGVAEGVVSVERLIAMLHVKDDHLVVEEKGLYSVESFIIARRMMYWLVYLHKNVISADRIVGNIIARVRFLLEGGEQVECPSEMRALFGEPLSRDNLNESIIGKFLTLDDTDLWYLFKRWRSHPDKVLSMLASSVAERRLFYARLLEGPFPEDEKKQILGKITAKYGISEQDASCLFISMPINNHAYKPEQDKIMIMKKSGEVVNFSDFSHQMNNSKFLDSETKYFVSYPKDL